MGELNIGIIGLGSALPKNVRGNDYWADSIGRPRKREFIAVDRDAEEHPTSVAPDIVAAMAVHAGDPFRGARQRHVLGDDEQPSDLEANAGRIALADARVDPDDIGALFSAAVVWDHLHPPNSGVVQHKLGLRRAGAWSVDLTCASVQPQLLAAAGLIHSGIYRHVLVTQSCGASRVVDKSESTSTQMGDAGAAAVLGPVPAGYGILGHYTRTEGRLHPGIVYAQMQDGEPQRRWWEATGPIRLTSFDVALGREAGARATEFCREACAGALADAGLTLADIDFFLCNQSLGWFVDACRRALELPWDKTIDTFARYGNIGPATILFNLREAVATGRVRSGDRVLLYSPGAGFTRTALVLRWWRPQT